MNYEIGQFTAILQSLEIDFYEKPENLRKLPLENRNKYKLLQLQAL